LPEKSAQRRAFLADPANKEFADFLNADTPSKNAAALDAYLASKGVPTGRDESILAAQGQPQGSQVGQTVANRTTVPGIPVSGEATTYYQNKAILAPLLDQYYGDDSMKALQDAYYANTQGAARTAWGKAHPQEYQTLKNHWDSRTQLAAQNPILADYVAWSKANQTVPEGQSKTDAFLRQYKPGSSTAAMYSNVGSLLAKPTVGVSYTARTAPISNYAPRTSSGGYTPRPAPQTTTGWDTFAARAGQGLAQEMEASFTQNTPLTPEATAYLQVLYQQDNLGTTTFEAFVTKLKGLYFARGKRANMPYWMQRILGYAK
jgi:hypothetical protein